LHDHVLVQGGGYASAGGRNIAVVDPDPFWVDGDFEETKIGPIHLGDAARVKLMGYGQVIDGHVQSIARGIVVANARAAGSGPANVTIFAWVRLAQRIPVRIRIDTVPRGDCDGRHDRQRRPFRAQQRVNGNRVRPTGCWRSLAPVAEVSDQRIRRAVVYQLGFGNRCKLWNDPLSENLAQLHAPLVK
jgi:hypothetical protein